MSQGIHYYVLDIETNGLVDYMHEICEVSIVRANDMVQLSRQIRVDKPQNSSIDSLRIIKKSMDDLYLGITKDQMIDDIEKFVAEDGLTPEHRCLVGHNIINFDRRFLWKEWAKHNKQFPFSLYLDTLQMMRAFGKKIGLKKPKINLGASCDLMMINRVAGEHNAISDTRNTYLLFMKLREELDILEYIKRMPHNLE
jgi:DNA polymerase III epsilon subunit-like protein